MFADPRQLCPRLLDYVVIVGSREPGTRRDIKTPELLRRYPPDDHADFQLPNDIVFFCQPEGCYSIGQRCSTSARKCVNFTFTLTDKDANKTRYGICSNFYRVAEPPPADGSMTPVPNVTDGGAAGRHTKAKKKKLLTLTSICVVSHHPFFTTFRQLIHVLQQMINACQQRVRHVLRPRQKLLGPRLANQPLWTILSGQITPADPNTPANDSANAATTSNYHHQTQSNQVLPIILHEIKQLETWMLTLLSAPVPIPAHTRVELELLPPPTTAVQRNAYEAVLPRFAGGGASSSSSLQPTIVFALPDKTRLPLVDLPVHFPFELMGIETSLRVLAIILLENKVVFQSRDFCALTQTIMSFVALLYPLEYMFPIIPLLPSCMAETEHLMLAPTPYIIGIPASFFLYKKDFVLPDDVWLVDIDASRIVPPEATMREERLRQNHLNQLSTSSAHHHHANHTDHHHHSPTPTTLSATNIRSNSGSNSSSRNYSPVPQQQQLNNSDSAAATQNTATWPLSELPVIGSLVRELRYALELLAIVDNEPQTQQVILRYQQLMPHERQQLIDYIQRRTFGVGQVENGDEVLLNMLNAGICGNADELDVYIRCALVRYFLSDNLLADLTEHCRVMRLFPRPVVAFQLYSFIKSRPQRTAFVDKLAKSQAIEYFAEWALAPTNLAFQRITTGVSDARAVGDKSQWFQDTLEPVQFVVYEKKTTLHNALAEYASHHAIGGGGSSSIGLKHAQQNLNSSGMGADEGDSPHDEDDDEMAAMDYGNTALNNKLHGRQSSVDDDNNSVGESDADDDYDVNPGKPGESTTTSSSFSSINEFVSDVVRRRAQRKQQRQSNLAVENGQAGNVRSTDITSSNNASLSNNNNNSVQLGKPPAANDQPYNEDEDDDAVCHGNARIKPLASKLPLCSSELDPNKLCHPPKTLRDAAGSHAVPSPSSSMTSLFSAGVGGGDEDDMAGEDPKNNNKTRNANKDNDSQSDDSGDDSKQRSSSHRPRAKKQPQPEPPTYAAPTTAAKATPPPRPPAPAVDTNHINDSSSNNSTLLSRDASLDSNAERRGSTRQASISSSLSAAAQSAVAAVTSLQRTDSSELAEALGPLKLQNRVHDIADKSRLKASRLLYKLRESSKEFMHDLPGKVEKKVEQFEQKFDKFADNAITRPDVLHHQQQQRDLSAPPHQQLLPAVSPGVQPTSLQSPQSEMGDVATTKSQQSTPPVVMHNNSKTNIFDLKSHMRKMVHDPKQQFAELRSAMDARIDQFGKEKGGLGSQTQTLLRKAVDEASKIAGHHNNNSADVDSFHRHDSVSSGGNTAMALPAQAAMARSTVSVITTTNEGTSMVDVGMVTSADQQFLREIANGVIAGDGVSWLKMSKLKELMKDETNRWLVVQCISLRHTHNKLNHEQQQQQQQRLYRDDEFIDDVQVTKEQFKGLKKLCEALIAGYEHTFNMWGLGGMGSVFGLLEIAYTHYYEKPITAAAAAAVAAQYQHQQNMQVPPTSHDGSVSASPSMAVIPGVGGENRLEEMATGMKSVFRSTMRNLRSQLGSNSPNVAATGSALQPPPVQEIRRSTLDDDNTRSPAIRLLSNSPSPNNSVDNLNDELTSEQQHAASLTQQQQHRSRSASGHSSPATSGPDDETNSLADGTAVPLVERSLSSPMPIVTSSSVTSETLPSREQQKFDTSRVASASELVLPTPKPVVSNNNTGQVQLQHHHHTTMSGGKPINTVLGPAFQEAPSPYGSSPASSQPGSRRSSRSSFPARLNGSPLANASTTSAIHTSSSYHQSQSQIHQGGAPTFDSPETAAISLSRRKKLIAHHTIHSQSVESNSSEKVGGRGGASNNNNGSNSRKSSITSGCRYQAGSIVPTTDAAVSQTNGDPILFLPERVYLFELLAGGIPGNSYSAAPLGFTALKRSKIWDQLQFWEDAFIDATAHERDLVGLGDADPNELLQRYSSLRQADRKQMENDEDKVLAIMMYNLCAFMVAMRVTKAQLRRKMQRLLGKSHLGLLYNPQINNLLDQVANLHGNDIDLKPPFSRQQRSQTYAVYLIPHADPTLASTSTAAATPTAATSSTLSAKNNGRSSSATRAGAGGSTEFAIDANQLIEQSRAFQEASRTAAQYAAAVGGAEGELLASTVSMNKNLMFMEVRDDGVLLKSMNGVPVQRCPYENLINMTFSPRTRVLCLWTRSDAQTNISSNPVTPGGAVVNDDGGALTHSQAGPRPWATGAAANSTPAGGMYKKPVLNNQTMLSKFYCRKCKELYAAIKTELGHAASKAGNGSATGSSNGTGRTLNDNKQGGAPKHDPAATWTGELGGDFPVQDQQTGEGGLLKVTMDGISLLFAESKAFVELARIRKCFTQEGGVFVLEEFDATTREISQRSFKSPMADQICYAVLCLFSYIAAGKDNSTITNSGALLLPTGSAGRESLDATTAN